MAAISHDPAMDMLPKPKKFDPVPGGEKKDRAAASVAVPAPKRRKLKKFAIKSFASQ
jgi:hypothetical protein